mmetsp:Transcript_4611/g.12872  ORF Transcript_4611/g.12872 Transcript_4611/m.12872 type:complete len:204 (-) Transcript_4611:600-1211(-)
MILLLLRQALPQNQNSSRKKCCAVATCSLTKNAITEAFPHYLDPESWTIGPVVMRRPWPGPVAPFRRPRVWKICEGNSMTVMIAMPPSRREKMSSRVRPFGDCTRCPCNNRKPSGAGKTFCPRPLTSLDWERPRARRMASSMWYNCFEVVVVVQHRRCAKSSNKPRTMIRKLPTAPTVMVTTTTPSSDTFRELDTRKRPSCIQ